jgi:hypothetical protein
MFQVMIHDRYLFDRDSNQWTVGRYLGTRLIKKVKKKFLLNFFCLVEIHEAENGHRMCRGATLKVLHVWNL